METYNPRDIHFAGWLLLTGAIAFWIGAGSPPYKQWTSPLREYLEVVGTHKLNWYWIHACFVIGVLLTLFGLRILTTLLRGAHLSFLPELGFTGFFFGSILWILSIAFRVTGDLQAGIETVQTGSMPEWIEPLHRWSGLLFGIYMVLAYVSIAVYGEALLQSSIVPFWSARFAFYFGLIAAPLFLVGFPLFAPPLMVHLPFAIIGFLLIKA